MASVEAKNQNGKSHNIVKQGWILKKSKHIKNYRKRWMILKGYKLLCYKTRRFKETKERPTEVFDLSLHRYRVDKHDKIKEKFYLIDETLTNSRTFKGFAEKERDEWVYIITNTISISREISFDKLYVKSSDHDRSRGFTVSATFESSMASKSHQDLHDSESEESDNDFGGYIVDILNDPNNNDQRQRKPTVSKRKLNIIITEESFRNFKVESLTIDGDIPDFSDEDSDDDSFKELDTLIEEKEEFEDDDDGDDDDEEKEKDNYKKQGNMNMMLGVNDDKQMIVEQLEVFGYDRNDTIKVMENAVNPMNINEIKEKLDDDENSNASQEILEEQQTDIMLEELYKEEVMESKSDEVKEEKQQQQEIENISEQESKTEIIEIESKEATENKLDEIKEDAIKTEKKMDQHIMNRLLIEQELISTEQIYYDGLYTLLNELIDPMFDRGYIDKKYYKQIRSSLPKIFEFHKKFLNELQQNNSKKNVIKIFNEYIMKNKDQFIDINTEYIKDYETICGLFGWGFHGNLELETFLESKSLELKPLSNLLMLPLQRLPKYIYLLKNLRKNTIGNIENDENDDKENINDDDKDINDAVEMMEGITREIKERKQKIENLAQCLQIQQGLKGLKKPIVEDERVFVEQFVFIKKEIKHQRIFFLFNDILIITNEKWKVKHILEVRTLDIKDIMDPNDNDNKKQKENIINNNKRISIKKRNSKKKLLPEFKLISVGSGSAIYIAEDMKTINKFIKLVGKLRIRLLSDDVRERNNTLGTLKNELARQSQLYD